MHEISRHWRLREHRLRLAGFKRELEDGTIEVSLTGSNWVEARHNGHRKHEDPFAGRIIYQAQPSEEQDPAIPFSIHSEVEISASSD